MGLVEKDSRGNKKLQEFIATKTNAQTASQYKQALSKMEKSIAAPADNKGIVLRKMIFDTAGGKQHVA